MSKKYVSYYRVSTVKQGQSGLGLEAQRAAVVAFVKDAAGIIKEFVEVESGKRDDRPQLAAAIDHAKKRFLERFRERGNHPKAVWTLSLKLLKLLKPKALRLIDLILLLMPSMMPVE